MMFDPELAAHLLTRKVEEAGSLAWNAKLAKLRRWVEDDQRNKKERTAATPQPKAAPIAAAPRR
jgi:hypothetical protein